MLNVFEMCKFILIQILYPKLNQVLETKQPSPKQADQPSFDSNSSRTTTESRKQTDPQLKMLLKNSAELNCWKCVGRPHGQLSNTKRSDLRWVYRATSEWNYFQLLHYGRNELKIGLNWIQDRSETANIRDVCCALECLCVCEVRFEFAAIVVQNE